MKKLLIDISYYQVYSKDIWDKLATFVDGIIIRLGFGLTKDSMFETHKSNCISRGLPYAAYWWVDPTVSITSQVNLIYKLIKESGASSLLLDFEQYWTDWKAYMSGDYAKAYASRMSPETLDSYYHKIYKQLKSMLEIPVGGYSADWFIDRYAPGMKSWVFEENYWEARYLRWYDSLWLKAKMLLFGKGFSVERVRELAFEVNIIKGVMRQFESYFDVEGTVLDHLDWSIAYSEDYNRLFLNKPVVIPPEPPVVPDIRLFKVLQGLRVRAKPTTESATIGWLHMNEIIKVESITVGWAKLSGAGYCSADSKYISEVAK